MHEYPGEAEHREWLGHLTCPHPTGPTSGMTTKTLQVPSRTLPPEPQTSTRPPAGAREQSVEKVNDLQLPLKVICQHEVNSLFRKGYLFPRSQIQTLLPYYSYRMFYTAY